MKKKQMKILCAGSQLGTSMLLKLWYTAINGRSELMNNGRTIKFEGFPTGSGPSFFQGKWKLEDLAGVLDQVAGSN